MQRNSTSLSRDEIGGLGALLTWETNKIWATCNAEFDDRSSRYLSFYAFWSKVSSTDQLIFNNPAHHNSGIFNRSAGEFCAGILKGLRTIQK